MTIQSNEPTVEDKNACFAQFMGGNRVLHPDHKYFPEEHYGYVCHKGGWWNENNLQYHSSWDWIMPVVKKILHEVNAINSEVGLQEALLKCDLSAVHLSVYKFIKWYSQDGI